MERSKGKKQVYNSMMEFKKKFFPNSFGKQLTQAPPDSHTLGISLAKESLDMIRRRLVT